MTTFLFLCFLSALPLPGRCYFDVGQYEKRIVSHHHHHHHHLHHHHHPVPRPRQLPSPTITTPSGPYLITSSNDLGNATLYTGSYRGLFSFEPLEVSCTPCPSSSLGNATTSSTLVSSSCTEYEGVFRSPELNSQSQNATCFPSGYGGVFSANTTTSTTVPCCSSSSSSDVCLISSSVSTSYSGVFRPTTFASNDTFLPSSSAASPASFPSNTFATLTSSPSIFGPATSSNRGSSAQPSSSQSSPSSLLATSSSSCSYASTITAPPNIATLSAPYFQGCASFSGTGEVNGDGVILVGGYFPVSSCGRTSGFGVGSGCGEITGTGVFTGSGILVACAEGSGAGTLIGSGTVWVAGIPIVSSGTAIGAGSFKGCGTIINGSGVVTASSILNVTFTNSSLPSTTEPPFSTPSGAIVIGAGTGTGRGLLKGTGTVYLGGIIPVVSSGTVSGGGVVIGSGTIYAEQGHFTGSGEITGCGRATGSGTIIGSGTAYVGPFGLITVRTSGTADGYGTVEGCGTIYGSGTFTMDVRDLVSPTTRTVTSTIMNTTASYGTIAIVAPETCFPATFDFSFLNRLHHPNNLTLGIPHSHNHSSSSFRTGPGFNDTTNLNSTMSRTNTTNPLCHKCDADVAICCPPGVRCGGDGMCPRLAVWNAGWFLEGRNVTG